MFQFSIIKNHLTKKLIENGLNDDVLNNIYEYCNPDLCHIQKKITEITKPILKLYKSVIDKNEYTFKNLICRDEMIQNYNQIIELCHSINNINYITLYKVVYIYKYIYQPAKSYKLKLQNGRNYKELSQLLYDLNITGGICIVSFLLLKYEYTFKKYGWINFKYKYITKNYNMIIDNY